MTDPRRPVTEDEVAGRDVREDGVHAAAVAAALVVQLHAARPHLQRQLFHDHLRGLGLVLLAFIPVLWGIPHDEVCTANRSPLEMQMDERCFPSFWDGVSPGIIFLTEWMRDGPRPLGHPP